jgi:hypothetical protein
MGALRGGIMSVGKFTWRTLWQEASKVARTVKVIVVTLPALLPIIVRAFGGAWSKDLWPWWVWISLVGVAVFGVLIFDFARRVFILEQALEPRIRIIGPTTHTLGGAARKTFRTLRIEVENISTSTIKNAESEKQNLLIALVMSLL